MMFVLIWGTPNKKLTQNLFKYLTSLHSVIKLSTSSNTLAISTFNKRK